MRSLKTAYILTFTALLTLCGTYFILQTDKHTNKKQIETVKANNRREFKVICTKEVKYLYTTNKPTPFIKQDGTVYRCEE